jgi:cobalt-zinc-cadmium efflux system protein
MAVNDELFNGICRHVEIRLEGAMETGSHLDRSISSRLKYAIGITSVTLLVEIAGGIWTNSLALLSDAAHVFLDLFALILSFAAIKLASYPATDTRTFGWHRSEVFASFINGATVFLIAIAIAYEAIHRLLAPQEIKSLPMFIIAAVGLVTNLLAASALHSHSHDDLNVRSAFLHVVGDAAVSVGVIVAGITIYFTGLHILDPIASMVIGCTIIWGAWRILRESTHILLEGVPRGLNTAEVVDAIRGVTGVREVHHFNLWTICSHIIALSAHIDIDPQYKENQAEVLRNIEELLFDNYHISHTTLQVECTHCVEAPVIKVFSHRPRKRKAHEHVHGAACSHGHHGH